MTSSSHHPNTMWIFDVDGVLTNPEEKRIIYPELTNELIKRLKKNEPIALNTGRSFSFIEQEILHPLQEKLSPKEDQLLSLVFPVGEYGGVWMTYEHNEFQKHINSSLCVPVEIEKQTKNFVEEMCNDIVFFDTDKRTMISLELQKRKTIDAFRSITPFIIKNLQNILHQAHFEHDWIIQPSRISIDLQHWSVGKHYAITKILELIKERNITPKQFVSFGDSLSDVAMHEALLEKDKPSHFVFVGEKELLREKTLKNYEFTSPMLCDKGTLTYLKNH